MISRHYTQTASTERLGWVVDEDEQTNKREYQTNLASVKCHVQADTDDITKDGTATFGKDWLMFCAIVDIIEGDRVTIGSNKYRVVGVSQYPALSGRTSHMEVKLRLFKS